jgi:hypothetical protein
MIHLHDLLPEEISDETAVHLTNFVMDLALAIESHYFTQIMRYRREENPLEPPEFLRKNLED